MKNVLVIGAGLSGVTVARQLAHRGCRVTVIDQKNHVGGHCFDYEDSTGIRVHKFGPHIFHTSNKRVTDWLSRFTEWVDYEHRVVAELKSGEFVPFPPNLNTMKFIHSDDIINTFYRPYSEKMWGVTLEEINPNIFHRVPMRQDFEDRYFPKSSFQKFPKYGYTNLVSEILSHKLITVKLGTPFSKEMMFNYDFTFNSMSIDEFFDYKYGMLPYRSIRFHHKVYQVEKLTIFPVVNYTNNSSFTRRTEWKNFPGHGFNGDLTLVTEEEPCDFRDNDFQRYYPISDPKGENRILYNRYKSEIPSNMVFIGRCGMYVYINMDQAISSALSISQKVLLEWGAV
ncbi:FAD-dependent oxidoreductase [Lacimonas salitolerans]|uniref:FAD-dependent oxidoreductase n=1 Tax=Lacimonas salitolerans TaxID=1323750 RepID=A0ABW4EL24_9RHOB